MTNPSSLRYVPLEPFPCVFPREVQLHKVGNTKGEFSAKYAHARAYYSLNAVLQSKITTNYHA